MPNLECHAMISPIVPVLGWLRTACIVLTVALGFSGISEASESHLDRELSRKRPWTLSAISLPANVVGLLSSRVKQNALATLPVEPDLGAFHSGSQADAFSAMRSVAHITYAEEERILLGALLWRSTGASFALEDARRRAHNLAKWSPRGVSGALNQDQAARSVAWTLALAYDWLYDQWTRDERRMLLGAIRARVDDMLGPPVPGYPTGWAGLDWGRKMDRQPYDSHGITTMARLSVICTALRGEDELFDKCAAEILPRYLKRPIPWGGGDGGFANGTTYAHWGLLDTHFVVWQLLKNLTGADLWNSDWAKGYVNFAAYFLPPGAPSGLFGDEAERPYPNVWATQAKAIAAAKPSLLAEWYARNNSGGNLLHLALLLAPPVDLSSSGISLPGGTPNGIRLADVGWVAMHSDLADRSRTSVYFKSSPFGSYNHSHADQNSFVIHARGRSLAIDSGYYDYYGSPHWKNWYKQTRAHNAITFDGGQGQLHDTLTAKGTITRFEHNSMYDISTGDATAAYGGALTRSVRSIFYVRPGSVLVYDSLASATPRTWEWNLHAQSRMKEMGARSIEIDQDGVRLCVSLLDTPDGAFSQNDQFTTGPQGNYPKQWHAKFSTAAKLREATFVAILDVHCNGGGAAMYNEGGQRVVQVGNHRVTLLSDGSLLVKR
jgi:hypothetical protein